jgi:hypothetical protein
MYEEMLSMIRAVFVALIALASPNPYPTLSPSPDMSPPPFPPDGSYSYAFYRDGKRVGNTTVVVERRASDNRFDVFEQGSLGDVAIRLHGGLTYADLQPKPWDVTYAGVTLPTAGHWRDRFGPAPRYTVRYEIDQDGSLDVIDGIQGGDTWPLSIWSASDRHVRYYMVLDQPFMGAAITVPATLALRNEGYIFQLSEAFPRYVKQESVAPIAAKSASSDRWPNDQVIAANDFRMWYDRKTLVVHQVWFKSPNVTVQLETQTPSTTAAIGFGAP